MAVGGIGGEGAASLDRFQQIRDLARKRMEDPPATRGDDSRARAADLLKRKQAELGQGIADRPGQAAASASAGGTAAAGAVAAAKIGFSRAGTIPAGTTAVSAYGRAGGTEKADPKPRLGRYIDLTA